MYSDIPYLFNRLDRYLDEDLDRFELYSSFGRGKNTKKKYIGKRDEFVKYLVSVATHPIGLLASVSPYNSSPEDMLAYIVDMFAVTNSKIEKIILGTNNNPQKSTSPLLNVKRRHSWRPEIRIRLSPPTFFYKQHLYLNNLNVRIYLFKEELENADYSPQENASRAIRGGGTLSNIFKKFKLNSSLLIRPVNEMRRLVKFVPIGDPTNLSETKLARSLYKMIQLDNDGKTSADDIHLNIRRYYCEPKNVHILRFEFWLNRDIFHDGIVNRCRRCIRRLVFNGFSSSCPNHDRSAYMNDVQEFYGYINIRLTQLPSYATKHNYPILSLQDRKVNSCEICIDLGNRRIANGSFEQPKDAVQPKKSGQDFLINHMRLYINCVLYQCLSLSVKTYEGLADSSAFISISLDNLFYLPAFTLINQHRLQSNINQFEDQCLKRVAILVLLMKLDRESRIFLEAGSSPIIDRIKYLLISVLQNEYLIANKLIDDRTLQEIDPFRDENAEDTTRSLVVYEEFAALGEYVDKFLSDGLRQWLLASEETRTSYPLEQHFSLLSLKLVKTAIVHFKKCAKIRPVVNLNFHTKKLKSKVEQLLCTIIITHLKSRMEGILESDKSPVKQKLRRTARQAGGKSKQTGENLWRQLLHDIKYINHDLCLYWSEKGLDGIVKNEVEFVGKLKMFESLNTIGMRIIIEEKIDNYLR